MQRSRVLVLLGAVLYGALAALATGTACAQNESPPPDHAIPSVRTEGIPPPVDVPAAPGETPPPADITVTPRQDQPPPPPQNAERPHIAALLPLKSPVFGRIADAVRRGIEAGMAAEPDHPGRLPVLLYPTGDDPTEIVNAYDQALRMGAQFVIGPLTKSAVHAIANSSAVTSPTLGLSIPDSDVLLPDGMYAIGIDMEAEARQVAQIAGKQGKRRAVIITADNSLSRRISQAFANEWAKEGRLVVSQYAFTTDQTRLKAMSDSITSDNVDALFFALDGPRARQIRPYLGKEIAGYATSLVYSVESTVVGQLDLSGLVFVDMPWMVKPDDPVVMAYPRPEGVFSNFEQQRFYALGIDAWRISQLLLNTTYNEMGMLDGVSGYITPGPAHEFQREDIPAVMTQTGVRAMESFEVQ
ncbi:MAG: ABC transporter substrate-binding protein [Betaproteobacteria bacterium]|nr:ABC transporter substrate-binding protein [Betaproteobacteria bacterium]